MSKIKDKIIGFIGKHSTAFGMLTVGIIILLFVSIVVLLGNWITNSTTVEDWLSISVTNLDILDILLIGFLFRLFGVFNPTVEVKK